MSFTQQFQKYDFPKLGYIRIPKILPNKEEIKRLNLPNNFTSHDFLRALSKEGFNNWYNLGRIPKDQEKLYANRLNHELKEIINLHFTDYILMVYRIVEFCKANNILMSPSRGSCGGSLLLAFLGCTYKLDPLKMDLLFERFVSAARTEIKEFDGEQYMSSDSLPDIDCDVDQRFKNKTYHFLETLFPKRVAHIANISTFQSKVLLKEVLKVYNNFSEDDTKPIAELIDVKFGKVDDIETSLKENKEFIEWAKNFSDTIEICKKLSGLQRNKSVHAAGIILCNDEIINSIPLEFSIDKETNESKIVTAYNMESAQKFGIKVDLLSLKNLSSIQNTLELVNKTMDEIDINDESIYEFLRNREQFYGIFQAEENLGKTVLRKIQPKNINDIGISVALGRPGCMSLIDSYLHFEPESLNEVDERVRPILAKNRNCIIFQETIMELAKVMANFSPREADGLRKGIGKKLMEKILAYKEQFINRSLENGYKKEFIDWCWNIFEASGNYSFNRSHALGYGALLAICAYLKANHPLEYFVSLLNAAENEQDPRSEIAKIAAELPYFNIELLPPSILKSTDKFTIQDGKILFSMTGIKGINKKGIEKVKKLTNKYSDKFSIYSSFEQAKVPINILVSSILVGAFDNIIKPLSRSRVVLEAQVFHKLTDNEKLWCHKLGPEYNYDLVEIIKALNEKIKDEKGGPIIKDSRRLTIRKNIKLFLEMYKFNKQNEDIAKYIFERFYIGFSYSTNLYDIYKSKTENLQTIQDVQLESINTTVKFVAEIAEVKKGTTKNGNKKVQIRAKDHTGDIRVMIFDTNYNRGITKSKVASGRDFKEGDIIVVQGNKKEGNCVFGELVTAQNIEVFLRISQLPKNE